MPIIKTKNGEFHYESFGQGEPILFYTEAGHLGRCGNHKSNHFLKNIK